MGLGILSRGLAAGYARFALGFAGPSRLSTRVRELLEDQRNELVVSTASAWEIATKFRLGKLPEATKVALDYLAVTKTLGVRHLNITARHALTAGSFRVEHRDPFDRMLAAQSLHEGIELVSRDECFALFPVRVLW